MAAAFLTEAPEAPLATTVVVFGDTELAAQVLLMLSSHPEYQPIALFHSGHGLSYRPALTAAEQCRCCVLCLAARAHCATASVEMHEYTAEDPDICSRLSILDPELMVLASPSIPVPDKVEPRLV